MGPVVAADGTVTAQACEKTYNSIRGGASASSFDGSAITEAAKVIRKEWLQELAEDIGAKERRVKALNSEIAKINAAAEAEAAEVSKAKAKADAEPQAKRPTVFVPGPGGGSTTFVPGPGGGSIQPAAAAPDAAAAAAAVFVPGPGGGSTFVPGPGGGKTVKKEETQEEERVQKGSSRKDSSRTPPKAAEAAAEAPAAAPPATPKPEEESDRQRRARIAPLLKVLKLIHQNKHALYFRNPVTEEEVDMDEYMSVVKEPMDLTTVRTRLEEGAIDSAEELWEGLMRIVDNALKFNESDSDVYDKAQKLREFMRKEMESVLEVEKMIASSPHNTATRNRGPRAGVTPASGRKSKKDEVEETRSTKKRSRKGSHVEVDEEEEDEPEEKRQRRGKDKDEDAPRAKTSRGRAGRRKS